jgi:hypothetical protein
MQSLRRESSCWGWSVMVNFMAVTTVVLIRAEGELRLVYNTQRVKLRTFIVPFPPPNLPTTCGIISQRRSENNCLGPWDWQ